MADVLVQGRVSAVARELLRQGQETEQSVIRVEVSCLFAVAEGELVFEAVDVPVRPIAGKLSFIRDLPKVPRFTITNLTARVERSSGI